jgi:transcriptional regulator with XRE-family HTH domain
MARRPKRIENPEFASGLREALRRGAFAPDVACKVLRALQGKSQAEFAGELGVSIKVIKALESGRGNVGFQTLEKIASAAGLRVAFADARSGAEILDPDARAAVKQRRRASDAQNLASGNVTEAELHRRNAMQVDDLEFDLPVLV